MCAWPTRRSASARRPRSDSYLSMAADHVGLRDHRRGGDPPRLRLPLRERQFRAGGRGSRHQVHRPLGGAYPHDGRQDHRQGHDAEAGRALRARLGRRCRAPGNGRGHRRRYRLPGHHQGDGGRRRARHEARPVRPRSGNAFRTARSEAKAAFGNDEVYIEKYLGRPAISRCRSSATARAARCIWASATVRCSGATRRCWRRPPAPPSTPRPARDRRDLRQGDRRSGLRGRGHDRVSLRGRRVLFHRDEHPPSGRTPGDRGDLRRRSRARADPRRRRCRCPSGRTTCT
jgi:hypothetical protein